jgi:hypothetical protein
MVVDPQEARLPQSLLGNKRESLASLPLKCAQVVKVGIPIRVKVEGSGELRGVIVRIEKLVNQILDVDRGHQIMTRALATRCSAAISVRGSDRHEALRRYRPAMTPVCDGRGLRVSVVRRDDNPSRETEDVGHRDDGA